MLALINDISKVSKKVAYKYEIIVIDDGCTDSTAEIVTDVSQRDAHVRLIQHAENLGYGASIRSGIRAATMDWIFYTDGDRQFDVSQLARFVSEAKQADVVIGYRKRRADGALRSFNAYLFGRFVAVLFRLHVRDVDCAFKLMKASVVKRMPFISTGAMISSELLYRLKKKGVEIVQLPVSHFPREYGTPTGNNPKVVWRAMRESLRLYIHMKFDTK